MAKKTRKPLTFPYALRSYRGYLIGTDKSEKTQEGYLGDLKTFEEFLDGGLGSKKVSLLDLTPKDLEQYHAYLKLHGLKTNTRRRKILTVRRFLKYLNTRKKMDPQIGQGVPAPYKVEKVPGTFPMQELLTKIQALPHDTDLLARNRLLLWVLAETGAQVSEVAGMTFSQWKKKQRVEITGKAPRELRVSEALYREVQWLDDGEKNGPLFLGFNKFGPLKAAISPRGVELLVKSYGPRLGYPEMTPRMFRHSAVLHWFAQGIERNEIRIRLGLKTDYAFRVFEPLFRLHGELQP